MYATFQGSKVIVDYLMKVEGFNSLTDTDEVTAFVIVIFMLSIFLGRLFLSLSLSLSLYFAFSLTHAHLMHYLSCSDVLILSRMGQWCSILLSTKDFMK